MQLTLTITDSDTIPATALEAFVQKAISEGKTPEQKLAELITKEAQKQKGPKAQ
jgi:hypothetical protein